MFVKYGLDIQIIEEVENISIRMGPWCPRIQNSLIVEEGDRMIGRLIRRFNEWLAVKVTRSMATMWCAYVFLVWSLIPLVWPEAESIVFYVSGGIIQLVALSLIMVGQNVLGQATATQAKETHDTVLETYDRVIENNDVVIKEIILCKEELALVCEELDEREALLADLEMKITMDIKQHGELSKLTRARINPENINVDKD